MNEHDENVTGPELLLLEPEIVAWLEDLRSDPDDDDDEPLAAA
jgi:hypothetical protein